jgi:energy-coupling factor transporter ATP-binding protein EcfA2
MTDHFEITFPLILTYDDSFTITFELQKETTLKFKKGVYYLRGDNGSGKTSFLNMLALTAGTIGEKANREKGTITFSGEAYNGKGFDHIRAAEIRENSFCIFPQKAFFLPVSARDNYMVLNGSDRKKANDFSPSEFPDLLSGGQQQKVLMDIVLDAKKPIWFLDEPLTNLDAERRHYFWKTLEKAYRKGLKIAFFIDHWMGKNILDDRNFRKLSTMGVFTENRQKNRPPDINFQHIDIFENNDPEEFFLHQVKHVEKETVVKKSVNPLLLKGDWGVKGQNEE